MRIFFVPAGAVEWIDNWDVIGLNGHQQRRLQGRRSVRAATAIPSNREHLPRCSCRRPLYKFPLNGFFSIGFSGRRARHRRAMLDAAIALAMEKTPRLAKMSLLDNHHVQFQIGEAEARLRSARNYVETTAQRVWDAVVRVRRADDRAAHRHPHGGDLCHSRGQSGRRLGLGGRRRAPYLAPVHSSAACAISAP